jgi:acyl-coenzyme A thioesterase PaaI-like protein
MSDETISLLNGTIESLIPVAHRMGVTFVEVEPGLVRATVPFEGNGNHFGVVYAGVIFTVAEVLGGAIHFATFDASTHYPLVRRIDIDFIAPGTTDLTAIGRMTADEIARIKAAATPDAKVPFVFETEVLDTNGTVVARTRGDYQLRPHGR